MQPAAISISTGRMCQFSILSLALPGHAAVSVGVFLFDRAENDLQFKLRDDWSALGVDEDDQEYLAALDVDFQLRIREIGAEAFLLSLEDSLSGVLRISDREAIAVTNVPRTLQRLFDKFVDAEVRKYVTHLPLYSLRAAATKFGEDVEVEELEWLRAPEDIRLKDGMFIAQVVGRSMEPLIPDGSYCIFRAPVVGSRQGKRLLIQEIKAAGSSSAFTVKRYSSRKTQASEEEWRHESIRLEPLNPEFEAFDLAPDEFESRYRVIAEFVEVLD
jgi:phage repressor protein C with HTH and peptisase S24 domain